MTTKFCNRVRMSVSGTPGTGTITLNTAAVGFQAFNSAGMGDGDQTPYLIEDGSPVGSAWEFGLGTWHSNGTFTRDTVTQSSAGGTTKISVTSAAIISAIFRASDLAPQGQSSPSVVQYGTYQGTTNPPVITLGATPTPGNFLIAIANGGGGSTSGTYYNGFGNISWQDRYGSFPQTNQYQCNYLIRAVRSGDGASWTMGLIGAGGPTFNVVLAEVSGVDISRVSEIMMKVGPIGTLDVACPPNSLMLAFVAGDPNTITVSSPSPQFLSNNFNGSSMAFAYDNASDHYNGIVASISTGNASGLVMALPGV